MEPPDPLNLGGGLHTRGPGRLGKAGEIEGSVHVGILAWLVHLEDGSGDLVINGPNPRSPLRSRGDGPGRPSAGASDWRLPAPIARDHNRATCRYLGSEEGPTVAGLRPGLVTEGDQGGLMDDAVECRQADPDRARKASPGVGLTTIRAPWASAIARRRQHRAPRRRSSRPGLATRMASRTWARMWPPAKLGEQLAAAKARACSRGQDHGHRPSLDQSCQPLAAVMACSAAMDGVTPGRVRASDGRCRHAVRRRSRP